MDHLLEIILYPIILMKHLIWMDYNVMEIALINNIKFN